MLFPFAALLTPGCGSTQPVCTGGLQPYKNKCLSTMAIQYVECTEGRGISTTTKIGGGVGGTLKVVANASVNLAFEKARQENTPVALQIVKDCMEIAKSTSSSADPEQNDATFFERQFEDYLDQWRKRQVAEIPRISLSSSSARVGEQVTVSGSNFQPNDLVEIVVHATLVTQVEADENGEFSTVITVPSTLLPGFDTQIGAKGEVTPRRARAPFRITE